MSSPDARAVPDDFFADDESYVPKRALEDAAELKRELIVNGAPPTAPMPPRRLARAPSFS